MVASTLEIASARGLLADAETLHMDRGHDRALVRLAITRIITVKLFKWADRWSPQVS